MVNYESFVIHEYILDFNAELLVFSMLVLAIPSIVFTYKCEKKYEKMLKDGTK